VLPFRLTPVRGPSDAAQIDGGTAPALVGMAEAVIGYQCLVRIPPFRRCVVPSKSANIKNEKQYEALKDKGMSKERAARIANDPKSSEKGGKASGGGKKKNSSSQGGTSAQKKKAGRKGGQAAAKKS
jgi:hypothetical protein